MERCAVTESTNRYLNEQAQEELTQDHFVNSIQDELESIEELIGEIKRTAERYEGCDFADVIKELITEML